MANEAEIAGRTKLIADAMFQANRTLRDVLRGLEDADRRINSHLGDLQKLSRSASDVQSAESKAEWHGQIARTTRDHDHMEQWNDADMEVRTEFSRTQAAAGQLASQIGGGQRELATLGDDLDHSAGGLKRAMEHLEALNELPEYAGSGQSSGLRAQIEHLQQATARADAGITSTIGSLDTARRAAITFETRSVEAGEYRHTRAVQAVAQAAGANVAEARTTLRNTGNAIYEGREGNGRAAQFGIDAFNANREAERAAAAGAQTAGAQVDPELVHAMNAGTTPGPAAGTGEPPKPVDPRIDYTTPARVHEAAGQRDDRGAGR